MNRSKKTQGFALVITLLITALVGTLVTGSLLLSMTNRRISSNDALSTQALNVAQAGNAYWKAELVNLYRYMMEHFDQYEDDMAAYLAISANPPTSISCDNYFAMGIDLNRDGAVDTANATTAKKANPQPLLPNVTIPVGDANGEAQVSFYIDGSVIGLRSRGTFAGARATVVEEFSVNQIDLWNNAVFAETSAANTTISGRAEIRGSVHILGEGLTSSDVALDITGSFGLGNTYEKINSSLGVTSAVMGLTVPNPTDLCATLRVKSGYVKMEGSSNIGYKESENAEPFADNMRGIYTNHGIQGGTEGTNVHSKNGIKAAYDAGDSFDFPELNDVIPDETITWGERLFDNALVLSTDPDPTHPSNSRDDRLRLPHTYTNPSGVIEAPSGLTTGDTYLHQDCLLTTAPLFGVNANGTLADGVTLATEFRLERNTSSNATPSSTSTPSFRCVKYRVVGSSANLLNDDVVTEVIWRRSDTVGVATSGDTVPFNKNQLYVGGTGGGVVFWGKDLTLVGGGGSNDRITYRGDGVLFTEDSKQDGTGTGGNIKLALDFLPSSTPTNCTAGSTSVACAYRSDDTGRLDKTTLRNSYPATTLVGLVARKTVSNDGAQLRFTAAIYAEESVFVAKQTLVAGSIVTKSFDAGSNVPTVLYVPNLAQRLSRMMPGAGGKTYAVSNVAWNRR